MNINQSTNNVNFTSIIPLEVFYDGSKFPCTDINITEKTALKIANILKNPANGNDKLIQIKKTIAAFDKDFAQKSKVAIRVVIYKGFAYLFTGKQAEIIKDLGEKLGQAAADFKGIASRNYFEKISELLNNPNFKIKEHINPVTHLYEGQPIELHAFVNSSAKDVLLVRFNKQG